MSDMSYAGQFGAAGSWPVTFSNPCNACTDGTYIYVIEKDAHRLTKLNLDGSIVASVGSLYNGNPSESYSSDGFANPSGVATDGTYVYVTDTTNCRVKQHLCSDLSFVTMYGLIIWPDPPYMIAMGAIGKYLIGYDGNKNYGLVKVDTDIWTTVSAADSADCPASCYGGTCSATHMYTMDYQDDWIRKFTVPTDTGKLQLVAHRAVTDDGFVIGNSSNQGMCQDGTYLFTIEEPDQNAQGYGSANMTVNASNNKMVSSTSYNFVTSDVGKYLEIYGGAAYYTNHEILSINGTSAVLASSPAPAGSAGLSWYLRKTRAGNTTITRRSLADLSLVPLGDDKGYYNPRAIGMELAQTNVVTSGTFVVGEQVHFNTTGAEGTVTYFAWNGSGTQYNDLSTHDFEATFISSAGYEFTEGDIGKYMFIQALGWASGTYTVVAVSGGWAVLNASPGHTGISGGSGTLRTSNTANIRVVLTTNIEPINNETITGQTYDNVLTWQYGGLYQATNYPFFGGIGIAADGTFIYVADYATPRLMKIYKTDFLAIHASEASADSPAAIVVDNDYLYTSETIAPWVLRKRNKSTYAVVDTVTGVGSYGHSRLATENASEYLYWSGSGSYALAKVRKSDLTVVATPPAAYSTTPTNTNFYLPYHISINPSYTKLYIQDPVDDTQSNNRIKVHRTGDLSYAREYNTTIPFTALYTPSGIGQQNCWNCIAITPTGGDLYAAIDDEIYGGIWKFTGITGSKVSQGAAAIYWNALACAPNGDIYAVGSNAVYKQTGGSGSFTNLGLTSRTYNGVTVASNGDVYVSVQNGDIYMQAGGSGSFDALNQTTRYWDGMAADTSGNVYACAWDGFYKRTNGTGDFTSIFAQECYSAVISSTGDIYVVGYESFDVSTQIYKQTGGTGSFVSQGQGWKVWSGIAIAPNDDIYTCVRDFEGNVYKMLWEELPPGSTFKLGGVCVDSTHVYFSDNQPAVPQVHKRLISDFSHVDSTETHANGPVSGSTLAGVAISDTYLYVVDNTSHRIYRFNKA